ncbi:MAG: LD-carboxypeptidase [Opitutaceae bacterium]|nr:LD-carboxypeptidase [Opitutaceae bacterium]
MAGLRKFFGWLHPNSLTYYLCMKKPAALQPGDTIRLIAPSSPPKDRASLGKAIAAVKTLGFRIKYSDTIFAHDGYLAGSDEERAKDFQAAFNDSKAKAVLCVRGGFGATRILNLVDWDEIREPKIFLGFSDITALSCALWEKCEFPSFSGPVLTSDLVNEKLEAKSWNHTISLLTGEKTTGVLVEEPFNPVQPISLVPGESFGRLMGGNLSMICSLLGTPWFPNFGKSILFLEDIGESPYRVDRHLTQLLDAGVLQTVSGIALGDFRYSDAQRKNDRRRGLQTMESVFLDRLGGLGVPVLMNLPFGHIKPKITLPFGVVTILDSERHNLILQESGVEPVEDEDD